MWPDIFFCTLIIVCNSQIWPLQKILRTKAILCRRSWCGFTHEAMSAPTDSDLLARSCREAAAYPRNIVRSLIPSYHLDDYYARLGEQSDRLFSEEAKTAVDVWEFGGGEGGASIPIYLVHNLVLRFSDFQSICASSTSELKRTLEGQSLYSKVDPICRFMCDI
jgi:hypothetical protein